MHESFCSSSSLLSFYSFLQICLAVIILHMYFLLNVDRRKLCIKVALKLYSSIDIIHIATRQYHQAVPARQTHSSDMIIWPNMTNAFCQSTIMKYKFCHDDILYNNTVSGVRYKLYRTLMCHNKVSTFCSRQAFNLFYPFVGYKLVVCN